MATEESEKKIADAEEEEDKTPPRALLPACRVLLLLLNHIGNNPSAHIYY